MIRLTSTELMIAGYVGCGRYVSALAKNWQHAHGAGPDDAWTKNIEGAAGELAVAKALGIYWLPVIGNPDADDVGPYQVRTNNSRRFDDTILRPASETYKGDRPDRVFIGVLSFTPDYEIMGWIWGRDGMQERWLRKGSENDTRPAAYFVPRQALNSMETLPSVAELLAEEAA